MSFGVANRAIGTNQAYFILRVIARHSVAYVLGRERAGVLGNDVKKTAARRHRDCVSFSALVHPGYAPIGVKRVYLVWSSIGNTRDKRLVRDRFSFGATKIRNVSSYHQSTWSHCSVFGFEWLDDYGHGAVAFSSCQDFD